jgi:hypothetical protein
MKSHRPVIFNDTARFQGEFAVALPEGRESGLTDSTAPDGDAPGFHRIREVGT